MIYLVVSVIFVYLAFWFLSENLRMRILNSWLSLYIAILIFMLGFLVKSEGVQQAAFTFSSVYLGFWLSNRQQQQQKADKDEENAKQDKRRLKFFLGIIWQELRFNKYQLEEIKKNFSFYVESLEFLEVTASKLSSIQLMAHRLKSTDYQSFISTGYITLLGKDELFNCLQIAYSDVEYLKSFLVPLVEDAKFKLTIGQRFGETLSEEHQAFIFTELKKKLEAGSEEIAIAYRTSEKAIEIVLKELDELGLKSDVETLRTDVLTQEDRDFIGQATRAEPRNAFRSESPELVGSSA